LKEWGESESLIQEGIDNNSAEGSNEKLEGPEKRVQAEWRLAFPARDEPPELCCSKWEPKPVDHFQPSGFYPLTPRDIDPEP